MYGAVAPPAAQAVPVLSPTGASRTRVVLLGTAGGPALRPGRSSPAAAVVVDGVAYVVDCGYGVGRQLVDAKIPPTSVRQIFLTHHHSDHNADLGNLLVLTWATGLQAPIHVYGPPLVTKLTDLALQYHAYDIGIRIPDEGRPDPRPLFLPHEVAGPGPVFQDERVKVTALTVNHPPVVPAYAYKFETPDRTIVFSGDTTYWKPLIAFARGADLLVHEILLMPALDRLIARVPNAARLREHIVAAHTAAEDVGRVAAAARVKRLALTHFVPSYDPTLSDEDWIAPVRASFHGEIVAGRDLLDV
ncbi:MAG: MBL fold metallo-hydrolase [Candidatus Eremiobacteraeota bacterium]|nr:MBL fold metallo-hydrolase [Candidatus Eremiobacteraeota bacterium]MBV8354702.1 MBL fold metallo-hydrolase [Candidatus Eremiobacteraeota bacterium]